DERPHDAAALGHAVTDADGGPRHVASESLDGPQAPALAGDVAHAGGRRRRPARRGRLWQRRIAQSVAVDDDDARPPSETPTEPVGAPADDDQAAAGLAAHRGHAEQV